MTRRANGAYLFDMAEMYAAMLSELSQYLGTQLTGPVVEKFKMELSVAALHYGDGCSHQKACNYVAGYLGDLAAHQFVDYWSAFYANSFISIMSYLPTPSEEVDAVLVDDFLTISIYDRQPSITLKSHAQALLDEAEANMDFIPETIRNALGRL